ncbi:MAG TPA: hypothetical protein VGP48_09325 [Stellaceae bacterium]|nr:hypothetical protein [Stellaceae bacterium]
MSTFTRLSRWLRSAIGGGIPLTCLVLAGCAAPPPGERVSYVSAVGTPFYIAFKIPTCAATLLLAAPAGALQGLAAPSDDAANEDIRPGLDAGIQANCGPPYVLPPE